MNIVTLSVIIFQYLFIEISTTWTLFQKKLGTESTFPFWKLLGLFTWWSPAHIPHHHNTWETASPGSTQPLDCFQNANWLNLSDLKLLDVDAFKTQELLLPCFLVYHLSKWKQIQNFPYLMGQCILSTSAIWVEGRRLDLWGLRI